MTRRGPLLAAVAATALVLAACTPDPPKPNYSSVSPTPSANTSSSSTSAAPNTTANVPSGAAAPTKPAGSTAHTSDGAFAFVAYYWQMVDWAYSTNNGDVLTGLYQPTCASCASFRSSINESSARGYTLVGGHISISSVKLAQTDNVAGAEFGLDVALSVDMLDSKAANGSTATSYPPSTPTYRMYVAWLGDEWQIIESATVTT